jgi:spore germination protein GerM
MKRFVAAATAVVVLLAGCGVIRESNKAGAIVSTSVLDMSANEDTGRVLTSAAVYFLNETSKTLTAEPRRLVVETDTNPARAAVQALLAGPSESMGLTGVAPAGMTLDYIEFSRQVANVYLSYDGEPMEPKAQYILEQAIANTVTDVLGATHICVFLNGLRTGFVLQAGLSGVPSAPLKKQTGNVDDMWAQASGKSTAAQSIITAIPAEGDEPGETPEASPTPEPDETPAAPAEPVTVELQTVLYYISADGSYLLPEVHTVKYTEGKVAQALIAELQKTPNNAALMKSPIPEDVELLSWSLTDMGDGARMLSLNFSKRANPNAKEAVLSYASIIYTLTGFIPDVKTIEIKIAGKPLASLEGMGGIESGIRRSDFIGYIGSSAPLYFTDKDSDLLLEVSRSMEQSRTWSARARVLELLKGPLQGDGDDVLPVMITGMTEDDVLSVDVYADTAYVNLSPHFKDVCAGISARTEMLLVYAIVNTITAMDGVNKVQFLIAGQQTQTLAGTLCLADPFLKNYGIIKKTG